MLIQTKLGGIPVKSIASRLLKPTNKQFANIKKNYQKALAVPSHMKTPTNLEEKTNNSTTVKSAETNAQGRGLAEKNSYTVSFNINLDKKHQIKDETDEKDKQEVATEPQVFPTLSLETPAKLAELKVVPEIGPEEPVIWDINDHRSKEVDQLIAKLIIEEKSWSFIEKESFKTLIATLNPRYELRGSDHFIKNVLPSVVEKKLD